MESNISSRNNGFPAGLRVLVVDDDQVWLKVLERMLIKCSYEVTTCCLAREALEVLRKKKDGFDIVISDVNMPDMDGFKLLELVGLEMNLPVIMMSVDGETSRVMKGVQHGACDYLLKPVRMKELQNIWQHVFRKKINKPKNGDGHESNDDMEKARNGLDDLEDWYLINGGDLNPSKKRKDNENHEYDNQDNSDPSVAKKARVVWSVELHKKFLDALNQIGFDSKVGPKKILDLMNVPWLTRENVASHLQKYRLYLSRLQKQNEPKTSFCSTRQSEITSKDSPKSFDLHDSMMKQQNQTASCSFRYSSKEVLIQDMAPEILEDNSMFSFSPSTKCTKVLNSDISYPLKSTCGSRSGITNSFISPAIDGNFTPFQSQKQSRGEETSMLQFIRQPKEDQDMQRHGYLPLPSQQSHVQADSSLYASSDNHGIYIRESDKLHSSTIQSVCVEYKSSCVNNEHLTASHTDLFSIEASEDTSSPKDFVDQTTTNVSSNMEDFSLDEHLEVRQFHPIQDYTCTENFRLDDIEVFDFPGMDLVAELPSHSDYSYDLLDYPVKDQGLFIA
ncbi:hypothetical protein Scep_018042 [Stephania cephalantha]|uniref:Two-component response regulator n=1 Tax=Stephania cephalantha TaxID=152367 RepID=A0AAP0NVG2_9MAGN